MSEMSELTFLFLLFILSIHLYVLLNRNNLFLPFFVCYFYCCWCICAFISICFYCRKKKQNNMQLHLRSKVVYILWNVYFFFFLLLWHKDICILIPNKKKKEMQLQAHFSDLHNIHCKCSKCNTCQYSDYFIFASKNHEIVILLLHMVRLFNIFVCTVYTKLYTTEHLIISVMGHERK